jgi:hypothetical protein
MRRYIQWLFSLVCLVLMVSAVNSIFAQASGGTIQYGGTTIGRLDSTTPSLIYTFNGTAGDMIRARALGAGGLNPSLSLVDAENNVIISGDDDPLAGHPNDSGLAYTLPETGTYGLVVSAADETSGEYLLQLILDAPPELTLPFGETVPVELSGEATSRRFALSADASCENVVSVVNTAGDNAPFAVRLLNPLGQVIAQGSGAGEQRYTVAPDTESFAIEVSAVYANALPALSVTVGCADALAECLLPAAGGTPYPAPTFAPPAGMVMTVQTGGELAYGNSVITSLFEGSGLINYTFSGEAGDVVTAEALSISAGSNPALLLLTTTMLPVAFNEDAAFPFGRGDSTLTATLPESGLYALIITSDALGGTFWLRLSGGLPQTENEPFGLINQCAA